MKLNIRNISLTLLFAGLSLVTFANGDKNNGPAGSTSANTADVKYITGQDGQYLFHVVYNNASGSRFSLIVLDEDGNQLFQSLYSDKNFDKKFRLADPEEQFTKLTFVFRNFSDNSVQRYEVRAQNKVIENVEVKEVR
ncbi:MAG: hypothetical protein JST68_15555 [Bacteroidetes bacterium]|nr:hypothetical protein [Bacteroidota bacterium]